MLTSTSTLQSILLNLICIDFCLFLHLVHEVSCAEMRNLEHVDSRWAGVSIFGKCFCKIPGGYWKLFAENL